MFTLYKRHDNVNGNLGSKITLKKNPIDMFTKSLRSRLKHCLDLIEFVEI